MDERSFGFRFSKSVSFHLRIAPSVLACFGFLISKVSSVITSPQASFIISNPKDFHPLFRGTSDDYYKHCVRTIGKVWLSGYEHWQHIIEPLLIDSKSPYSTTARNVLGSSTYKPFSKDMFAKVSKDNDLENLGRSYASNAGGIKRLATHLLLHAVDGRLLSHCPFLHGRKFVTLEDGTLCLVPASTEAGNFTCFLFGDGRMAFVIRPKELEQEQVEALSNSSILKTIPNHEKLRVSHYDLVGPCFVDKWMDSEQFRDRPVRYTSDGLAVGNKSVFQTRTGKERSWKNLFRQPSRSPYHLKKFEVNKKMN